MNETTVFTNFQHIRDHILDIGRNIKIVEELILGTDNNCKSTFVEPGFFNKINKGYKTFKRDATMERMKAEDVNSNIECIVIDSSDSDLDDDYYTKDSEEVVSIEFCDTTAMIDVDQTTECAIVDIEMIEDNNNDPNNNFDSMESYEEEKDIDSLPGCSKDFDKEVNSKFNSKLKEEAVKIHSLLPQMRYQNIFATLYKNRDAENRVLLTLWDLLPYKRPYAKKIVGNNTVENDGTIFQTQDIDNSIDQLDIKLQERKEKAVFQYKTPPRIQNKILQPAKLKLDKNLSATTFPLKNMLRCTEEYGSNKPKNRMLLSATNVFKRNSANNFGKHMNKYIQHLQYIQKAKSKNGKKFNSVERNVIRQSVLHKQFKKSYIKASQFIQENNKLEVSNIANIPMLKCASSLQDSSSDMSCNSSSEQLNKCQYTPGVQAKLGDIIEGKLSEKQQQPQTVATVVAESSAKTQTFELVKRKECIQEEIVLSSSDEEIFRNLKSIFPEIDEACIKGLCLQYSGMYNDPIKITEDLIDYIITNIDQNPIKKDNKRVHKEQTTNITQQVATLANIFPNADETYLKEMLQRMNEKVISDYIEAQCKNPTYITKEEVSRKIKNRDQCRKYGENFDVKMFLEIFPNPFQYFENPNRKCKFNGAAINFLKSKFSYITEDRLQQYYKHCKYNLTLSAQKLEASQSNISKPSIEDNNSSMANYAYITCDDIPLMQEFAFITHKVQIRDCMIRMNEEKIREFENLKCRNGLWQCECCYDAECMPSECFTCSDGHIFCKSCIKKGIEVRLAEGDTRLACFLTCEGEFSYSSLKEALSSTEFSFLLNKIQEVEVMAAGITGLVSCPFCPFASIPPSEDKIFRCFNPECMKESCRLCKKLNHVPLKCNENNNKKARLLLEEKMTEALIRKCKRCSKPYYKTDGCNKITCSCGATMCYICDTIIAGYEHFHLGKCSLHSDNNKLHNDTVNAVANATLKYIAEKDPNVQIDGLLHNKLNVVPDADVSIRVNQVANFNK